MNCQELDDASRLAVYRKNCLKCLRELSKTRNIVPPSLCLSSRYLSKEGAYPIGGGGFAVSIRFTIS